MTYVYEWSALLKNRPLYKYLVLSIFVGIATITNALGKLIFRSIMENNVFVADWMNENGATVQCSAKQDIDVSRCSDFAVW